MEPKEVPEEVSEKACALSAAKNLINAIEMFPTKANDRLRVASSPEQKLLSGLARPWHFCFGHVFFISIRREGE